MQLPPKTAKPQAALRGGTSAFQCGCEAMNVTSETLILLSQDDCNPVVFGRKFRSLATYDAL